MGKLQVLFRIRLAYPAILPLDPAAQPAVAYFPETGNTVRVEAPRYGPPANQPLYEGFEQMILCVERECTDEQGRDTSPANRDRLRVDQDAAKALWQLLEGIREAASRRNNVAFMLPVVPSENIQSNPLVRRCELEWNYNGECLQRVTLGGIPAIQITDEWWADAVKHLASGQPIPAYKRFASDALYFAEHDPPRAIIMACAAWETALRYYLEKLGADRDPAYRVASDSRSIPTLYAFAKSARGGEVFHDAIDRATDQEQDGLEILWKETLKNYRQRIIDLPKLRNRLLHRGEVTPLQPEAMDFVLAVWAAIDWLFAGTESRPEPPPGGTQRRCESATDE